MGVKVRRAIASARRASMPTWTGSESVQLVAAWGFPGGSVAKESACQCNRLGSCRFDPWVGKIPWSRKWQPLPVFLHGKSRGQRSLVGYGLWGCEELAMTEHTRRYLMISCVLASFQTGNHATQPSTPSSSLLHVTQALPGLFLDWQ